MNRPSRGQSSQRKRPCPPQAAGKTTNQLKLYPQVSAGPHFCRPHRVGVSPGLKHRAVPDDATNWRRCVQDDVVFWINLLPEFEVSGGQPDDSIHYSDFHVCLRGYKQPMCQRLVPPVADLVGGSCISWWRVKNGTVGLTGVDDAMHGVDIELGPWLPAHCSHR